MSYFYYLISLLAQTPIQSKFLITPPLFWLIAGTLLCVIDFLPPQSIRKKFKFIALTMGISALIEAWLLWMNSIWLKFDWRYIMYEDFDIQIMLWMGISFTSVIWIRRLFLPPKNYSIPEATNAKTLTEIPSGEIGRVLYEGCSWQALCQDCQITIPAHETVYVLRREGNTLIVVPYKFLNS